MIIQTTEQLNDVIELLNTAGYVSVDTETDGLRPFHGNSVVGIALYFPVARVSYYLPVGHDLTHSDGYINLSLQQYQRFINAYNSSSAVKVFFNAKFDLHMMHLHGFENPARIEDVMLAAHLLNENESLSNGKGNPAFVGWRPAIKGAYTLKRLAKKYLGDWAVMGEDALINEAKRLGLDPKADLWKLPLGVVAQYAEYDVLITWELRQFYVHAIERWGMSDLYDRRNAFLNEVLVRMERNGIYVNPETVKRHQARLEPMTERVKQEIVAEAVKYGFPDTFNPGSAPQLYNLFTTMGYEIDNTDAITMQELANTGEPLATKVLEFRAMRKANSTYYDPYMTLMDEYSTVHTSLNSIGTVTGRLSSYDPNFQQIPRVEYNKDGTPKMDGRYIVKEVFEARPGYALVEVDYAQLELRLASHFADEQQMKQMFADGTDLHQYTADQLGVGRHQGKTANFSLLYGMGYKSRKAPSLFKAQREEVKDIVQGWRELYAAFPKALYATDALARQWRTPSGEPNGKFQYIRLQDGRCRRFHEYLNYPYWDDKAAHKERKEPPYFSAWNFVVQGTAGLIVETSLLEIARAFDNTTVRLLLTVHDSIIFECAIDALEDVIPEVKRIMTNWDFSPELDVDVKYSYTNWLEMIKYD